MRYGVCCIVLDLENNDPPKKFQKITYKRFTSLPREEAVGILSQRILNNIDVTFHAIKYCHERNYCYRLSSDLFPLITYDKAEVCLQDLPDYEKIKDLFGKIKDFVSSNDIRISCHPGEYTVLASKNEDAVNRTIRELNFYSWFMDQIGCAKDYNSPINIHVHSNDGDANEIIDRLLKNSERLDRNCWDRLVFENDDKINCWSVGKLLKYYHSATNKPITFDYLHHKCHPDGLSEQEAILACYQTWNGTKPLFHYSESKEGNNPRAHCDIPTQPFNTYGLDFDIDFEVKQKEVGIKHYQTLYTV